MGLTNALMPGLSARPAHLALFGADELLHDFVHALDSLLLVLLRPSLIAADSRHQRRGAISNDIANARMRDQHAVIAGQRHRPKFAAEAQIDSNGRRSKPDHFTAKLPSSHAFARLQVG